MHETAVPVGRVGPHHAAVGEREVTHGEPLVPHVGRVGQRGRPELVGVAVGVGVVRLAVRPGRPPARRRLPLRRGHPDVEPSIGSERPGGRPVEHRQARPLDAVPLPGVAVVDQREQPRIHGEIRPLDLPEANTGEQQPSGLQVDRHQRLVPQVGRGGQPVLLAGGRIHEGEPGPQLIHPRPVAEQDQPVVGDPVEVLAVVRLEVVVGVRRQHPVVVPLDRIPGVDEAQGRCVRHGDACRREVRGRGPDERGQADDRGAGDRRTSQGCHPAAAHLATPAPDHRGEVARVVGRGRDVLAQQVAQLVHHGEAPSVTSSPSGEPSNMDRSETSAREVWLLTVPSLQPRTVAVSATLRSSK